MRSSFSTMSRPNTEKRGWEDGPYRTFDAGLGTFRRVRDVAERAGVSEEKLKGLLAAGEVDGVELGDNDWLTTTSAVVSFHECSWKERLGATPVRRFVLTPRHSQQGDCLSLFLSPEESFAERIDGLVTVYRSFATRRVVGLKFKNLSVIARALRDHELHVGVDLKRSGIRVELLIKGALSRSILVEESPELLATYQNLLSQAQELFPDPIPSPAALEATEAARVEA